MISRNLSSLIFNKCEMTFFQFSFCLQYVLHRDQQRSPTSEYFVWKPVLTWERTYLINVIQSKTQYLIHLLNNSIQGYRTLSMPNVAFHSDLFNISFFNLHFLSNFYNFLRHCKFYSYVFVYVSVYVLGVWDSRCMCAWVCLPCVNAWLTKGICIFNVITLFCMPHKNLWLHSGSSDSAWERPRARERERETKSEGVR